MVFHLSTKVFYLAAMRYYVLKINMWRLLQHNSKSKLHELNNLILIFGFLSLHITHITHNLIQAQLIFSSIPVSKYHGFHC